MTLTNLADEMRSCRKCSAKLSEYSVVPRPIFGGGNGFPIILIGQAPGKTEYERNAPFQGDAGNLIRSLFSSCGLQDFNEKVYQTSVTKCFPGRRPSASFDRVPSKSEVNNCSSFLVRQLALLKPKLVVCLGGLSWKSYVSMREKEESLGDLTPTKDVFGGPFKRVTQLQTLIQFLFWIICHNSLRVIY